MAGKLVGQVISVNETGDLFTDIFADQLVDVPRDERVSIACDGHTTCGIFVHPHGQPELTFCALLGADGRLRLIMVGESAHSFLGIRHGAQVIVTWSS